MFNDGYQASFLLLLPFLVNDFHINLTEAGLLGTIANSVSIFFAMPAGYIATKIGGLKTLLIAMGIYGLGFFATSLAPSAFWLFPLFIIAGIGFGIFHPIGFALVAKLSDKENRGKHLGNFTAIGDVGRIGIVTLFTFLIAYLGWRYTSMLYAGITISLAAIFFFFFLPKTEHFITKEKNKSSVSFKEIIKNKRFLLASAAGFLDTFASSSLFIFLPFLLLKRGIEPALLGSFTAVYFFGTLFGKTALGRVADRFGAIKVFIASELAMALFILLLANATSIFLIIICSIILGIFTKGTVPVIMSIITKTGEHHGNFEKLFGVSGTVASIAATIAPVFLGFISDKAGIVMAFIVMGVFSLLAAIPLGFFHLIKQPTVPTQR